MTTIKNKSCNFLPLESAPLVDPMVDVTTDGVLVDVLTMRRNDYAIRQNSDTDPLPKNIKVLFRKHILHLSCFTKWVAAFFAIVSSS